MTIPETPQNATKNMLAWCGTDVGKETFDAALKMPGEEGHPYTMKDIPVKTFERSPKGVQELLVWLDTLLKPYALETGMHPHVRVVMESTGKYSTELAIWMIVARPSLSPAIINPERAKAFTRSLGLRNKTDPTDARALALYGYERRPVAYEPLSKEMAELRSLSRHRQTVIEMRVAEQNRLDEMHDSALVRHMIQRHVNQMLRDEKRIEDAMRKILEKIPEVKRDAEILESIYGIGFITAVVVLAELGDLRRFETGRQLSAFAGLSPCRNESGKNIYKKTKMSKKGNSRVRKALYMPAMCVIRGDNDLADSYRRLVAEGKSKKAALGVVMRKMLILMRAVLISGEPYQKHYRKSWEKTVEKKLNKQLILA